MISLYLYHSSSESWSFLVWSLTPKTMLKAINFNNVSRFFSHIILNFNHISLYVFFLPTRVKRTRQVHAINSDTFHVVHNRHSFSFRTCDEMKKACRRSKVFFFSCCRGNVKDGEIMKSSNMCLFNILRDDWQRSSLWKRLKSLSFRVFGFNVKDKRKTGKIGKFIKFSIFFMGN